MIKIATLKYLSAQKVKDAQALFQVERNAAAMYLMGYAVEFALKQKITTTLGFTAGFPETAAEFNTYGTQIRHFNTISTGLTLSQLRQLKHHRLNQLIIFSGAEGRIIANHLSYWTIVRRWDPENRYKLLKPRRQRAAEFMEAAKIILKEIS